MFQNITKFSYQEAKREVDALLAHMKLSVVHWLRSPETLYGLLISFVSGADNGMYFLLSFRVIRV